MSEGGKKTSIQDASFDYYNMQQFDDDDMDQSEDDLSHMIEIYDIPPEFKTEDLLKLFQGYQYVNFTSFTLSVLTTLALPAWCNPVQVVAQKAKALSVRS